MCWQDSRSVQDRLGTIRDHLNHVARDSRDSFPITADRGHRKIVNMKNSCTAAAVRPTVVLRVAPVVLPSKCSTVGRRSRDTGQYNVIHVNPVGPHHQDRCNRFEAHSDPGFLATLPSPSASDSNRRPISRRASYEASRPCTGCWPTVVKPVLMRLGGLGECGDLQH